MRVFISKQVYDQLPPEDPMDLVPLTCKCVVDGNPKEDCPSCDGAGVNYEYPMSSEDAKAIEDNFRSQGVPLGKSGTH